MELPSPQVHRTARRAPTAEARRLRGGRRPSLQPKQRRCRHHARSARTTPPLATKHCPGVTSVCCTVRMLLSRGTTIRFAQRQKINSFSILGVAYIARHGLVKNTQDGRKERQRGA